MNLPRWIHPDYFLVMVNKQKQQEKRERLGSLYLHQNRVFLSRNQQAGVIVRMGRRAKERLPEAVEGDVLLFHHCIEGSLDTRDQKQREINSRYLLLEDEQYRYYLVPASEQTPYAYAVVHPDGNIVTTRHWVLATRASMPESRREVVRASGLIVFENWQESREAKEEKTQKLKKEIEWLARSGTHKPEVRLAIAQKEHEMQQLSGSMNQRHHASFRLEWGNPYFVRDCGVPLTPEHRLLYHMVGDAVTELEWAGKTYSLLKTSQVAAVVCPN